MSRIKRALAAASRPRPLPFALPAGPGPPAPNTMKAGLLRGFYAHRPLSLPHHDKE